MPTLNDLRIAVDQGGVAPDKVRLLASTAYDLFVEDPSPPDSLCLGIIPNAGTTHR